jgi:outer membrane protein assembly factor BamA
MRAYRTLLACCAAVCLLGCQPALPPRPAEPMRVGPVHFVGNGEVGSEELRAAFRAVERMELPWPTELEALSAAISFAVRDTVDLLGDRGYADAACGFTFTPSPDRRRVDVRVEVREGPRRRLGTVEFIEQDADGKPAPRLRIDAKKLRGLVPLTEGAWYSRRAIEVGASAVADAYADAGLGARTKIRRSYRDETVDVEIEIRVRPAVDRVARIDVFGLESPGEVDRVVRALGLELGGRVDALRLEDARRRVMELTDLAYVDVQAYDFDDKGGRTVEVEVAERAPVPP